MTKIITLGDITSSIKIEYAATSPNLYSHDLDRNLPQHHNYNLGHWNGGNSENWNLYLNIVLSEKAIIYFKKVKQKDSNYTITLNNLSFCFNKLGDHLKSIKYIISLVDLYL